MNSILRTVCRVLLITPLTGTLTMCDSDSSVGKPFLHIGDKLTGTWIYKVADRDRYPRGDCGCGRSYSPLCILQDKIFLHLVWSRATGVRHVFYTADGQLKKLPSPEIFFKMPNSPMRVCLVAKRGKLGIISGTNAAGDTCFEIDLAQHQKEIESLRHAIDSETRTFDYGDMPAEAFCDPGSIPSSLNE